MDSAFFVWVILPVVIAVARIADVSIGTLRIICVTRSAKWLASLLGFAEVLIWITVISQLMSRTTSFFHYIAYAFGFAVGNLVGIMIEERLAFGFQTVRVITSQNIESLISALRDKGFSATIIPGTGLRGGQTAILFTTIRRKNVSEVLRLMKEFVPQAFISVEDVRSAKESFYAQSGATRSLRRFFPFARKGK